MQKHISEMLFRCDVKAFYNKGIDHLEVVEIWIQKMTTNTSRIQWKSNVKDLEVSK